MKYTFDVTPTAARDVGFPLDLLSLDACYPQTGADCSLIRITFDSTIGSCLITLVSNIKPTADAWKVRGWTVVSVTQRNAAPEEGSLDEMQLWEQIDHPGQTTGGAA